MTTQTLLGPKVIEADVIAPVTEPATHRVGNRRLFTLVAIFAMVIGGGSFFGGLAGAVYTWDQASDQNITTPDDAYFAEVPVRGPMSMWAQSEIITHHQLANTDGQYYSEMERQVPMMDEAGQAVLDEAGEPVMMANAARASWLTATTLTSALGLGILAYAVSAFAMVMGLTMLGLGWVVLRLRERQLA